MVQCGKSRSVTLTVALLACNESVPISVWHSEVYIASNSDVPF